MPSINVLLAIKQIILVMPAKVDTIENQVVQAVLSVLISFKAAQHVLQMMMQVLL